MEKKRLTVHGNEVTDGRFAWVTPEKDIELLRNCLLYTSPSPRDA